jgi:hypothetical protein
MFQPMKCLDFHYKHNSIKQLVVFCIVLFLCFVCLPPVSCVPNVSSVSGLSILDCPSVFSNAYLL